MPKTSHGRQDALKDFSKSPFDSQTTCPNDLVRRAFAQDDYLILTFGAMNTMSDWYIVNNIDTVDSPALLVYKDRVLQNIRAALNTVKSPAHFRPHVKTNKTAEVCAMMVGEGITKFKCATIPEAEMLGSVSAKDVLLAYQPVGPKAERFAALTEKYLDTQYSCLVDNIATATRLSEIFGEQQDTLPVFIDVNVGMNRTGIKPENIIELVKGMQTMPNIEVAGLHAYDGHIRDSDVGVLQKKVDETFEPVKNLRKELEKYLRRPVTVIAGGSPSFPVHAKRDDVECSPGTFVYWDWNYKHDYAEQPFEYAALVICRIISIIDEQTFCVDLGHKSIASEKPLPRVHFLNAPDAEPVSHSEEHMVVHVPDSSKHKVGDVLYGVPNHVCPTVALYERASVVENSNVVGEWKVTARDKRVGV